jgi:thiol-disulfide isomerase/thioredoxin
VLAAAIVIATALTFAGHPAPAPAAPAPAAPAPDTVAESASGSGTPDVGARAPEFPSDLPWLNVSRPLTLAELRGKVVLLDFWTFCCINCIHVLPDLQRLEAKYAGSLAVIGVHAAKFANEREADQIRQAILRYDITHPVVNDRDYRVWKAYGANGWPTLTLIDPEGRIAFQTSGEGQGDELDRRIGALVVRYAAKLRHGPLPLALEKNRMTPSPLSFPGKVIADIAGGRLFCTDSNHHRVVIASLPEAPQVRAAAGTGRPAAVSVPLLRVVGTGAPGRDDGPPDQATFLQPQGLALAADGGTLYVADTGNHLIRSVSLATGAVATIAGTGAEGFPVGASYRPLQTPLNSPWDLALDGSRLLIAMAGRHQLWSLELDGHGGARRLAPLAGNGEEGIVDGPSDQAALAQPSGLALGGIAGRPALFFADSEASAVRCVDSRGAGTVRTLVGGGLFEFGDADGAGDAVRLQHPLGVATAAGHEGVFVADTYNHKVKWLDPGTRRVVTLIGDAHPGSHDGGGRSARLNAPGGLAIAGDLLLIADTDNHLLRIADLGPEWPRRVARGAGADWEPRVVTLTVSGLEFPPVPNPFCPNPAVIAKERP